jgi:molybdopterin molybdotransferase
MPPLLPVDQALARILEGLPRTASEQLPLERAHGRILAAPLASRLTLPERDVSAMDGYAVNAADCHALISANNSKQGQITLTRSGESAAGHPWTGRLGSGEAVRIFTGAVVPDGADAIILQEDVIASAEQDGASITLNEAPITGRFIRPAGLDVKAGTQILPAGTPLSARALALALSTGHAEAAFHARPRVGILSTGDELVSPGETPGPGQIISSNAAFLAAFVAACGAIAVPLGIARDQPGAMLASVRSVRDAQGVGDGPLDLIVTTGGASVGVHDHIVSDLEATTTTTTTTTTNDTATSPKSALDFWKIAMRPGKPLIYGRVDGIPLLGLPGNPVSSAVCALIFLRPSILHMAGGAPDETLLTARLATPLAANDQRQDYLRARLSHSGDDLPLITPFDRQDSSMISVLSRSDALLVRPPFDPARAIGDLVTALPIPPLL